MKRIIFIVFLFLLPGYVSAASCGNGVAEGNEECDGSDLRGYDCYSICYFDKYHPTDYDSYNRPPTPYNHYSCGSLGSLSCTSSCKFSSTCHNPRCGDGVREGLEECDDGVQNSDTEPDACRTDCVMHSCGDGVVDSGEDCDDGSGNSDEIPGACRTDCRRAYCGDGVLDPSVGEECDDGNDNAFDGCHDCMKCYKPKDDLHIMEDARLCPGQYSIKDEGEEGVVIVSGHDVILDCDGAVLVAAVMEQIVPQISDPGLLEAGVQSPSAGGLEPGMQQAGGDLVESGPGASDLTIATTTTQKTTTTLTEATTTTTLKATTTTAPKFTAPFAAMTTTTSGKATTTVPSFTAFKTTSTTLSPTTTTFSRFGGVIIPGIKTTTTTTLMRFKGVVKFSMYAGDVGEVYRRGTGIHVTGGNLILMNCEVRNYNKGIKLSSQGNVLILNKACDNSVDVSSQGGSFGVANHCDRVSSWSENGVAGCTYRCSGQMNQNPCAPSQPQQQEPEEPSSNETAEPEQQDEQQTQPQQEKGLIGRIIGIFI